MNKVGLIILLLHFLLAYCKPTGKDNMTSMKFVQHSYDFHGVHTNDSVECKFRFRNTGRIALTINKVKASCNCTLVNWTKVPIKKNEIGEIRIKYSSAFPIVFHENILVYYNGKDSPIKLTISGDVTQNIR